MPSDTKGGRDSGLPSQHSKDQRLLAALKAFRPDPSARFYQRIGQMPWRRPPPLRIIQGARRLALPGLLIAGLLLLVLVITPAGRAAAQRVALFFERIDSNRTPVQVTLDPSGAAPRFTLSLGEAESRAGFQVRTPAVLPAGLTLQGAEYDGRTGTVSLDYRIEGSHQVLRLSQRRVGDGPDVALIGINAEVEKVGIADQTGEYVTGAWRLPVGQASLADFTIVEVEANWDPDANIQLLRWQRGEFLFEILHVGGRPVGPGDLDKKDLIGLAVSIP